MENVERFDPFEEDWAEVYGIQLREVYDIIYGSIMTYFKDQFMDYRVIQLDDLDEIMIVKRQPDQDEDKYVCSFFRKEDKIEIIYELKPVGEIRRKHTEFDLTNQVNLDKWEVFKTFRNIFNEHIKSYEV